MSAILRPEFPKAPHRVFQNHETGEHYQCPATPCKFPFCDCDLGDGFRKEAPAKAHRIPISGASPSDVAMVANSVDLIFSLAIGALQGQLENLRENLPVGEVKFDDIYAGLQDLRSGTLGRLQRAMEE